MKTEAKWLAAQDWRKLKSAVGASIDRTRKFRLFGVACCRRVAHLFHDPRTDEGLLVNERFADGLATEAQLAAAEAEMLAAIREEVARNGASAIAWARDSVWRMSNPEWVAAGIESCLKAAPSGPGKEGQKRKARGQLGTNKPVERSAQTILFRDIFANPFRPVVLNPAWLTSDVLALARGIYDDRAFDRMPILADALQDAGCDSDHLLNHCRGALPSRSLSPDEPGERDESGPHVRGCWVVDLLLGKE